MSYHILQQFDESLLSEIREANCPGDDVEVCEALIKRRKNRLMYAIGTKPTAREWALILITVIAATASLLYSVSVTHRLNEVQERLVRLESASRPQER
jgi:hypothetical protein